MIYFPHIILIEPGASAKLGSVISELGIGKRCAIFCDSTVKELIGKNIANELTKNKYKVGIFPPETTELDWLQRTAHKLEGFDFIIGMGGGKTIDIAKYCAYLSKKPWLAFPTIPSHDGIASSNASLQNKGKKLSVATISPLAIVVDTNIIKSAPYRHMAAGFGDLVSKFSAVQDWKLAERAGKEKYNEFVAEIALLAAKAVTAHVNEIKARTNHGLEILLWSLICAGFAMTLHGSSRPASGSEHNFAAALEQLGSKALHGEQVALGTIISVYLQGGNWKRIKNIMKDVGLPTTAKEAGISEEAIIKALVLAKDVRERWTILNEKSVDENEARKILKKVGMI